MNFIFKSFVCLLLLFGAYATATATAVPSTVSAACSTSHNYEFTAGPHTAASACYVDIQDQLNDTIDVHGGTVIGTVRTFSHLEVDLYGNYTLEEHYTVTYDN